MKEIWKEIQGYKGLYEASNLGRIRRLTFSNRVINKILTVPRVLNINSGPYGYLNVSLSKDSKATTYRVHRLILQTFKPGYDHLHVNHKNLNRKDNRLENLEWVTPKQNSQHAAKYGSIMRGETHAQAKITYKIADEIRSEYRKIGPKQVKGNSKELSKKYGLSQNMIMNIVSNRNWKQLRGEE